jgi:hypothetical protein
MRSRALLIPIALLLSTPAQAQVAAQPAVASQVTAENEAWYRAGDAILWNGQYYFPAGATEAFDPAQMVSAGSYRGIPLYTDASLAPFGIVFVPVAGGRVRPYQRRLIGTTANSVVSRSPTSSAAVAPNDGLSLTPEGYVVQAPAPPTFARSYDAAPAGPPQPISPAVPIVGTTGRAAAPAPAATSGRAPAAVGGTATAVRPTGINNAWIEYSGRRWVLAGPAVEVTADFTRVGDYRGSPIYQRRGDTHTIYVPVTTGLAAPFKAK